MRRRNASGRPVGRALLSSCISRRDYFGVFAPWNGWSVRRLAAVNFTEEDYRLPIRIAHSAPIFEETRAVRWLHLSIVIINFSRNCGKFIAEIYINIETLYYVFHIRI